MKSPSPLLILVLLLALATPGSAQKYHDALPNELKGPVKMLGNQQNFIYEYDTDGALTDYYYGNKEKEYGFKCERNAQGYVTRMLLYDDKACTEFSETITYEYNSQWQIVSEKRIYDDETRIAYYTYGTNGLISRQTLYVNGERIGTFDYDYEKFDEWGNWLVRSSHYDIDDSYEDELRFISYWQMPTPAPDPEPAPAPATTPKPAPSPEPAPQPAPAETLSPAAETGWQSLVGKRLLLSVYGPSRNGQELNRFLCTSGEYIELDSSHKLYWNNTRIGNIIYHYRIDGNRLELIQLTGKTETDDRWLELTRQGDNFIKTESNLGIYRYFSIED